MKKIPTLPMSDDVPIQSDWDVFFVIRTLEDEPRYIEQIGKDELGTGQAEYVLMYNIHFAKVFKSKPTRTILDFMKNTGIKAAYQQVPKEAYLQYQKYYKYVNGKRELSPYEELELLHNIEEYKREHLLDIHYSSKLGGKLT